MEITSNIREINIEAYNYYLPDESIAQFPLGQRDLSKLLIYKDGQISENVFCKLDQFLPGNSLVIFNETRVIHARLLFRKESGSPVEIFCLEPSGSIRDYQLALQQKEHAEWLCLVGNSKKWKQGQLELWLDHGRESLKISAERLQKLEDGTSIVRFSWDRLRLTFAEVLEAAGKIPLPPYISRKPVSQDEITYQTIYARHDGSVAAPTAGLHFTEDVMASLKVKNIDTLKFILHVGAGTFKPVSSENLAGHEMHAEQVYLPVSSLEALRASLDKPIIAVGTTTTRLLESLYWHGVKVIMGFSEGPLMDVRQWDPYDELRDSALSREEALDAVIGSCKKAGTAILHGKTSLMIAPGYRFRYPDILITNFHQPRSTLLLLIAAFIGEDWRKAYQYALDHNFRFLSYGDSCLFFNAKNTGRSLSDLNENYLKNITSSDKDEFSISPKVKAPLGSIKVPEDFDYKTELSDIISEKYSKTTDMPLTGIILAGGRSRRMGMEKGLVDFKGQPLINYSIKVLKELCSEILISSNSNCYDYLGYKVVPDLVEDSGPMGGIYSCLTESENRVNLFISCDMPFVTEEIFRHLVRQVGNAWICVPWYENDHFEPLCGLYLKDALPDMKEFIWDRNYKLPDLFNKTNISVVKVNELLPPFHEHYFMNINTPSDLAMAEKLRIGRFI